MTDRSSPDLGSPPRAQAVDLDEVRARRKYATSWYQGVHAGLNRYAASSADVPVLIAEVERLRAERDRLGAALDAMQEQEITLRSELKQLRAALDQAERQRDRLARLRCGAGHEEASR